MPASSRPTPGDWGIDVLAGELSGLVVVWQSKYFWPMGTRHEQADIRSSFASAVANAQAKGHRIRRWVLCVPCSMDAPTARWWDRWRARKQRETGIVIDLWRETPDLHCQPRGPSPTPTPTELRRPGGMCRADLCSASA